MFFFVIFSSKVSIFLGEIYADKLKGTLITEDRDPLKITENVDSVYQKVEKFQTIKSSLGCVEVRRHGLPGTTLIKSDFNFSI